jgi:tellurite methyltransferase
MSRSDDLSTAHRAWDERWSDATLRRDWESPEPAVVDAVPLLRERGVQTVLDVGCGIGRHALFLASQGFQVTGLDASRTGLEAARASAAEARLPVDLCLGSFTDLPFVSDSFDAVLSWNVIYHGDGEIAHQALREIVRTLIPGGFFLGTMISKRHFRFGEGKEIRPNTFVIESDAEKIHPHFYCDSHELMSLLRDFEVFRLEDRQQRGPGTFHFEFLAELVGTGA